MKAIKIICVLTFLFGILCGYTAQAAQLPSDDDSVVIDQNEDGVEIGSEQTKPGDPYYSLQDDKVLMNEDSCQGRVVEIISKTQDEKEFADGFVPVIVVLMKVKILSGARKGEIREVTQEIQPNDDVGLNDPRPCRVGDKITLFFTVDEYGVVQTGSMVDFIRTDTILIVFILFALFLLIMCGLKGIKSFGALLITCALVLFVMVPLVYDGALFLPVINSGKGLHMTNVQLFNHGLSPVLVSVVGSVFIIFISLVMVYGFTPKTYAAIFGVTGGIIVAGGLSSLMIFIMNMTGVMDEESRSLVFTPNGAHLDISGILFAAVLIGALGGTIDVGISIASAIEELAAKAKHITARELLFSGMNIGRDILGASLNTLVLAYVGGAMQTLILFYAYDMPLIDIIDTELISAELIRALAGSFGLLCTVPITSFVGATMMTKGGWHKDDFKLGSPKTVLKKFAYHLLGREQPEKVVRKAKAWKIIKGSLPKSFKKVISAKKA
ncbi:MAG: YibE/F family protein [Oscillospiraceae bacterium]|jgi:uncharacterized membrane protein|nr:YibE/F family protein [Oscillospiraceae bacterium]